MSISVVTKLDDMVLYIGYLLVFLPEAGCPQKIVKEMGVFKVFKLVGVELRRWAF